MTNPPAWKLTAQKRRAEQLNSIAKEWRLNSIPAAASCPNASAIIENGEILTPLEQFITSTTSSRELQSRLLSHELTAVQITTAFCKRAALLQQLTGCLTEIFFDRALVEAKRQDEYFERTGQFVGPWHGLPLSLKDSQEIEGVDTTVGWIGLIGKPAAQDSLPVSIYRKMGAIFYCKTNVPQSLMMSDSYNHVFGQSVNSLNRELISGGSSGGDGALVGAKGSLVGIGTDIGGSIRIPAALQGIYGLCPTVGRFPNRESSRRQKYIVPPVAGPLTTSIETVEHFMECYLEGKPWEVDPGILPLPWKHDVANDVRSGKKLKIGYVLSDGAIEPHPPITRCMKEQVKKLSSAGHGVFKWDASSHSQAYDLWLRAVLADGGSRFADLCKLADEPLIEGMLVGTPSTFLDNNQRQGLAEEIWEYQRAYLERWKSSGIDALIMPVTPWVGMKPKAWVKSQVYVGYTSIWNLLDYTALAIPAGTVRKDLDAGGEEWQSYATKAKSESDRLNHGLYSDLDLLDGMPVGLQVVTGRFGEEKAVALAKIIEALN